MKKTLPIAIVVLVIGGIFSLFQKSLWSAKNADAEKITEPIATKTDELANDSLASAKDPEPIPVSEPKLPQPSEEKTSTKDSPIDPKAVSYPSEILDLSNWKQTLPTGASKKPAEIKQGALATFSDKTCFHPNNASDGVVFRAPVNGVTTSNSGYPRSELREMTDKGASLASWSTTSGTHSLFIDQAITAVPKNKKHIVAGQIHDANDDVIVVRLEYPKLFIDINGEEGPTLDSNYTLGKRFTVKFVAQGGMIRVYYNGNERPAYTLKKKISGCYFKAGAYTQSNCSKESDCSSSNYGEVIIYKLAVQH
ncbi:MAG: polysaccharide lyase family 7 protein [Candidatus Moranbacteria bacterium]|nr:polysaccharide lyase family 7 protein [Candidatus Moranbacteria bacterium]